MIETRAVYEQLIQRCQRDLARGRWAAGERFPSERELCSEYGLSRATANKVLAKLVSEGWLEMRRGIGCFVTERPTLFASLRRIESFTEFTRNQGYEPRTKVLDFQTSAKVSGHVRQRLALSKDDDVIFISRLRWMSNIPVIHEERWLPARLYPRLQARHLEGSFYQLCQERYGLSVEKEEAEIRAVLAKGHPQIPWKCPSLRLDGTGYDASGRALWHQVLHYHGEHFALQNTTDSAASVPRFDIKLTPPPKNNDNHRS